MRTLRQSLSDPQEPEASTQDIMMDIVNYGLVPSDLQRAKAMTQAHIGMMEKENAAGRPNGPINWTLDLRILGILTAQVDQLKAQEDYPEYVWTGCMIS